jgi:flagellar M-ring protein FliF
VSAFWNSLSRAGRAGFVLGLIAIASATALSAWWALRTDYQVLFSDLSPQDAHAMTTELDRLKTPYQLSEAGTSILVEGAAVHATRLKLMGRDLPLHGAVGFELFNNTDFGMTEFAQKINYQRALQGEITRTIQSLAEVRDVRVLLAMPEHGLFKQANTKAKASITVGLKQGQSLRANQVAGIQRLVAASVPGMTMQEVTIVDNQGVALTRQPMEADGEVSNARLELKREMETYLSQKITAVLDGAYGAGQSLTSVDVVLNMEQVKTTTEDVLPAGLRANGQSAGVLVRERDVSRDTAAPADAKAPQAALATRAGVVQREVEYSVGRRVEHVITQPGSVRRLHVVAVVRAPLDAAGEQRMRSLVAAAAGAVPERGDSVVVQSLAKTAAPQTAPGGAADTPAQPAPARTGAPAPLPKLSDDPALGTTAGQAVQHQVLLALAAITAFAALAAVLVYRRAAVQRSGSSSSGDAAGLTEGEREAALDQVMQWLRADQAAAARGPTKAHP